MSITFSAGNRSVERVKRHLVSLYEVVRGSTVDFEDFSPTKHGSVISFTGLPGYEEAERYWVDAPFAFVSINYNPRDNDYLYYVVEPELEEWEVRLLYTLIDDLRQTLIHRRALGEEKTDAVVRDELEDLLGEYGVVVDAVTFYKLFYYLRRRFVGFRRIDPLMKDPRIEDISCEGYDQPLFVYHDQYTDIKTNITFDQESLDDFVVQLAQQSGRSISVADPITEATLPDESRCEFALGDEVTPGGSAFTIRKYQEEPMTPVSLMDHGTFSLEQMAYLWLAIEHNKSLIFAGGTASGKTTSMNAISMFIPPRSKVLTIEDTPEIRLYHENYLSAVTRTDVGEESGIDMYELLRSALRHRPEYIIVGEVRGREAMTLFQAMNTGHTTYSTMHADSIRTVINRLENEPINVPTSMIQSLDIVSIQGISRIDGERERRTEEITEVLRLDETTEQLDIRTAFQNSVEGTRNVFSWQAAEDRFQENLSDSNVLADIQKENGWSQSELEEELHNRKRVLECARRHELTDYADFTALVNEYFMDADEVLDRIDVELPDADSSIE